MCDLWIAKYTSKLFSFLPLTGVNDDYLISNPPAPNIFT